KAHGACSPLMPWTATDLVVRVTDSLGATADSAPFNLAVTSQTVNGYAIGTPINSGLLAGCTPVWGDEFTRLRINGASQPYERYIPNRTYLAPARGGSRLTTLDKQQNVDPLWTGHR